MGNTVLIMVCVFAAAFTGSMFGGACGLWLGSRIMIVAVKKEFEIVPVEDGRDREATDGTRSTGVNTSATGIHRGDRRYN